MPFAFKEVLPTLQADTTSEIIRYQYSQHCLMTGLNVTKEEYKWTVLPLGDRHPVDVVESLYSKYVFITTEIVVCRHELGLVMIEFENQKTRIDIEFYGPADWIRDEVKRIDRMFVRFNDTSKVDWYYKGSDGILNYSTFSISSRAARTSFYPWLKKPLDQYIDDYTVSDASVLILIGPPGTGKTSFLRHMIARTGGNAVVAYDNDVLEGDEIFTDFFTGDYSYMIMEDSDTFISPRDDGNQMMQKFLNLSDGIISTKNKKLVFTTNLPSVASIDDALMRSGRCFDVLEFRPLTSAEAHKICIDLDRPYDASKAPDHVTLADLLAPKASNTPVKTFGFQNR